MAWFEMAAWFFFFKERCKIEVSNFWWLEAGMTSSVWKGELPPRNTLAGGVKDGLWDMTEVAGYRSSD